VIDRPRAEAIATEWLRRPERRGVPELVLLPEHTREEPYGWVFFYQSREHVETGTVGSMLAGNAPLLVLRDSGELRVLGTARPVDDYLADYSVSVARDIPRR
jgi:hypothetical protein